jgi:hypothetical protein
VKSRVFTIDFNLNQTCIIRYNGCLTGNGGQDKFFIRLGDRNDTITDFGGVGKGTNPSAEVIANVDTLEFTGSGLTFALTAVGVDAIADFNSCEADKIILDKTTFSAITSAAGMGFNNLSDFEVTNKAGASTAKIVYDPLADSRDGQVFLNILNIISNRVVEKKFSTKIRAKNLTHAFVEPRPFMYG